MQRKNAKELIPISVYWQCQISNFEVPSFLARRLESVKKPSLCFMVVFPACLPHLDNVMCTVQLQYTSSFFIQVDLYCQTQTNSSCPTKHVPFQHVTPPPSKTQSLVINHRSHMTLSKRGRPRQVSGSTMSCKLCIGCGEEGCPSQLVQEVSCKHISRYFYSSAKNS